ncbi:hypothetical protein T4C_9951 [Trichinella pseudospiralis]|uniref:Uncharacterized protein n=1 Tax=Trichinella pseudospiralis TaxID=6337 RepID=A0A0V1JPZ5_TRIPS|nr:hypothetical protein T4C_9951 [Trichinella pseudospiralis]
MPPRSGGRAFSGRRWRSPLGTAPNHRGRDDPARLQAGCAGTSSRYLYRYILTLRSLRSTECVPLITHSRIKRTYIRVGRSACILPYTTGSRTTLYSVGQENLRYAVHSQFARRAYVWQNCT